MKPALGFWTGGLHISWGLTGAGGGEIKEKAQPAWTLVPKRALAPIRRGVGGTWVWGGGGRSPGPAALSRGRG